MGSMFLFLSYFGLAGLAIRFHLLIKWVIGILLKKLKFSNLLC